MLIKTGKLLQWLVTNTYTHTYAHNKTEWGKKPILGAYWTTCNFLPAIMILNPGLWPLLFLLPGTPALQPPHSAFKTPALHPPPPVFLLPVSGFFTWANTTESSRWPCFWNRTEHPHGNFQPFLCLELGTWSGGTVEWHLCLLERQEVGILCSKGRLPKTPEQAQWE